MGPHRVTAGIWSGGATLTVLVVLLLPQLVAPLALPWARTLAAAETTAAVVTSVAVIAGALVMHLHWRLTAQSYAAWMSAIVGVLGIHGLTVAALVVSENVTGGLATAHLLLVDGLLGLLVLTMVVVAQRLPLRVHSALVTFGVGSVVSLGHLLAVRLVAPVRISSPASDLITAAMLVVAVLIAATVLRGRRMPAWARERTALAGLLLMVHRAAYAQPPHPAWQVIAIVTGSAGALLILSTSLALTRAAIRDEVETVFRLREQVVADRRAAEHVQEQLHEVRGTVAGIATASHLIHRADAEHSDRRELLEEMLEEETARLQRLMEGVDLTTHPREVSAPLDSDGEDSIGDHEPLLDQPPCVVSLDDVLRPLVVARRIAGHDVRWQPSGQCAFSPPDVLATMVNILLDNAVKHAPGAVVTVRVEPHEDEVRVLVCDRGPGIGSPTLTRLFARGARGSTSSGSGLGLHIAHRLAEHSGHTLDVISTGPAGTVFAITLPSAGDDRPDARGTAGSVEASERGVEAPQHDAEASDRGGRTVRSTSSVGQLAGSRPRPRSAR